MTELHSCSRREEGREKKKIRGETSFPRNPMCHMENNKRENLYSTLRRTMKQARKKEEKEMKRSRE